jgi:YrbI family 3-deoxy-D-manno-octulosonate 8-phosphate phosphatase
MVVARIIADGADLVLCAGKTPLEWLVEACTQCASIDSVVIDSDRPEVVAFARARGLDMGPVDADWIVTLNARFPLVSAADLDAGIRLARTTSAARVVAVAPASGRIWKDGRAHDGTWFVELERVEIRGGTGSGPDASWQVPTDHAHGTSSEASLRACEHVLRQRERTERRRRLPQRISAVVLDFDGVFTDNQVLVSQDGREAVSCNRSDAFGLAACRAAGVPIIVMSTETNPVVQARCDKLRLPYIQGLADKGAQLASWVAANALDPKTVVYVGNDINDVDCLRMVGCAVVPADAHESILPLATIILEAKGGHGAVREICTLVAERMRLADEKVR